MMRGSSKRLWSPRLGVEDAHHLATQFLHRCQEKNVLVAAPATLYQAYRIDQVWATDGLMELSRFLRFANDDTPQIDRARDAIVRLLSVAVKGHFFLASDAVVRHEPYVTAIPDLFRPGDFRYGLMYPLESDRKPFSIVVSEWDSVMTSASYVKIRPGDRFPVVLSQHSSTWLDIKRWRHLKSLAQGQPWFEWRSWSARRNRMDQIHQHTDSSTFPYGTLLHYDRDIKDDVAATGAEYARGIKHWFLPTGWDVEAVKEYLDRVAAASPQERYQQRWWTKAPYPETKKT